MLVRCPGCSVAREVDRELAVSNPDAVSTCTNCGYTHAISAELSAAQLSAAPRERLNSIPGARAKLDGATEDLFRFSGSPGPANSIPVEREPSRPPARRSEPAPTSARKPEASIMFSLEELMKASPAGAPSREEEAPNQLWSMQAATPIFGTEQDLALLTAPVKPVQASSMDSMTMPSRKPAARRWLPLAAGGGATLVALAAVAWWTLGSSSAETAAVSAEAVAAAEPAPAPAPAEPAAAPAAAAPAEPAAPTEPTPAEAAPADPAAAVADAKAEGEEEEEEDAKGSKPGSGKARKKPAKRAPASTAAKGAFSTAAAKSALATAAAKAAGCKGTSGKGKVQLTFAPTGRVSSAQIVDGPFAGKPAGACALRHFKAARVPAFSGSPQTVAKSFTVP